MKKKLTWKIWLLIIFLVISFLSIFGMPPAFLESGVKVTSVDSNSSVFEQGLRQGQIIKFIDGTKINNLDDFSKIMQEKYSSNEKVKTTITTDEGEIIISSLEPPLITVEELSNTNIVFGLDLAGGSRALIKAENRTLSSEEVSDLVSITNNRFNVYGIEDISLRSVTDLSGNHFMLIEIAGATPNDLENLISKQGEFEAKIGNETVFIGGDENGVASVSRSGAEAGVYSCGQASEGYVCKFRFAVYLTEEAAQKQAELTSNLDVNSSSDGNYLSEKLDLYLDGTLVDSLLISESLKGSVTTRISISGSGSGSDQEEAYDNAIEEMNHLQTVLITGSLPYKLEIVKLDTISPTLGSEFLKSIFLAGLAALLLVAIVVFVRYKKLKSSLALLLTSLSEVVIILGIASLIEWNLDLPSIAGILATIGTGIDSQIIIMDEARQNVSMSIKQKLKRAFSIILGAYFTAVVALIPLYWAGAGLLKGFAVTTIIGITIGVLITRPAFTDMIRVIEE